MRTELLALVALALLLSARGVCAQALDGLGDPLPEGAIQRLGTLQMRYGGVGGLAYLPDGRGIVLTGGSVDIWDLANGELQARTKVSGVGLTSVQLRSDGGVLLLADGAGKVYEWDPESREVVRSWDTGASGLRSARYSPDEKRMLVASASPPRFSEWNLESGEKLIEVETEFATTRCGAIYGPEGKTAIMGGGYDHLLEHRDLATGRLLHKWGTNYEAKDIKLSSDGTCLLVGVESHAVEWKLDDYSVLHRYDAVPGEAGRCYAHDYGPLRNEAVCGLRTGSIHRWNRETGEEVFSWRPHTGVITKVCVSPDCQWVLTYGAGLLAETNMDTGQPRRSWDRHNGAVEAVAFLPSGEQVVSGSADATLRVWDLASGRTVLLIPGAELGAYALAVSPDGHQVAAGCKDSVVRVFSSRDGALLRELDGHLGYVRAVAYTHDGSHLLSSADDGSICVWREGASEPLARLEGHRGGVLAVAVSPDDSLVISGGRDGTVRLWDLVEGKLVGTFEGHRGWVEAVAFVGKEHEVISAGRDGRVLRWDLDSGEVIAEMQHPGRAHAVACSADGTRAYSAGSNRGAVCWDLAGNERVAEFKGHQHAAHTVAVSPDGKLVVTGSTDTILLVWEAPGD